MRKWLLAGIFALMFPWVLSLLWMRAVEVRAVDGKAAEVQETESILSEGTFSGRILVERNGLQTYMELEDYLPGIVLGQTEPGMELEAVKCQAVVARTYICRMMDGRKELDEAELDLTYPGAYDAGVFAGTRNRDQMIEWLKVCEQAVQGTCGVVMQYENRCILPLFHKISAGRTRNGEVDFPYLQAVESKRDVESEDYRTELEWSAAEFARKIEGISGDAQTTVNNLSAGKLSEAIQIVKKDDSGYVEEIKIGSRTYTGEEVQYALGLPSCCYSLRMENGKVLARVQGIGHGYGLSQAGADAMAGDGWGYEEILGYYYKNISLFSE